MDGSTGVAMRTTIVLASVLAITTAAFAQEAAPEGTTPGSPAGAMDEAPAGVTDDHEDRAPGASSDGDTGPQELRLGLAETLPIPDSVFDPWGAPAAWSSEEFRLALWQAPLGRVHYQLASETARLHAGGLVHGGPPLGLGLGTVALGDAGPRWGVMGIDKRRWAEMTASEKVLKGVEIGVTMGIVAAIVDALD
jgi:hypothetical protein